MLFRLQPKAEALLLQSEATYALCDFTAGHCKPQPNPFQSFRRQQQLFDLSISQLATYFFTVWITGAEYNVVPCFGPGGPQGSAHITDSNYCEFHILSSFFPIDFQNSVWKNVMKYKLFHLNF
jgi:hypothetical protein